MSNYLVICPHCLDSGWQIYFQAGNMLNKILPYQDPQLPPKLSVYEACPNCKKGQSNLPKELEIVL